MKFLARILKKMMQFLLVIFACVAIYVAFQAFQYWYEGGVNRAHEQSVSKTNNVFFVRGEPVNKQTNLDWWEKYFYWSALRQFPTFDDCTIPGTDNKFNWPAFTSDQKVQVCVHHLVYKLQTLEKITAWFESEGFRAHNLGFEKNHFNFGWIIQNDGVQSPFENFYFRWLQEPGSFRWLQQPGSYSGVNISLIFFDVRTHSSNSDDRTLLMSSVGYNRK